MLLARIDSIQRHLKQFIQQHFKVEPPSLMVETPPRIEFGDLAFPFPFELAKVLRKTPRQIAQEVADHIDLPPHLDRLEAAGAGYVNVFFKRAAFFRDLYGWLDRPSLPLPGGKVIVEHTNINPNKAAHIGHLRNAALGIPLSDSSGRAAARLKCRIISITPAFRWLTCWLLFNICASSHCQR